MSASKVFEPQYADLVRVSGKTLGGITGAYVVEYNEAQYVYKTGANIRHVINEYIAFQLYERVGVKVPKSRLVYYGENPVGLLIDYIEGKSPNAIMKSIPNAEKNALRKAVSKHYVFHALFANYDCTNSENYIVPTFPDGEEEYYNANNNAINTINNGANESIHASTYDYKNTYVIDLGGALFYRPSGITKGVFQTKSVPELNSIAERSKTMSGHLFIHFADSPMLKHRVVCEAWHSIDPTILIDFLRTPPIESLLITYEMTELARIMKGRIEAINSYCKESVSSSLSEEELYALSAELARDIQDYKNKANLESIKEKVKAHTEVLSYGLTNKSLLVQAYEKNPVLFQELLSLATKESLDTIVFNMTLLDYAIAKDDYATIALLISKNAKMTLDELNRVDILRMFYDVRSLSATGSPIGRLHVAAYESFPDSDIIMDSDYSEYLPQTTLNSTLDKQVLAKKPIHGYKEWILAQELYLHSSPRILSTVRAYTFRGDRLANSFLRGTLKDPHNILNAIRGDKVVPFAYQIYDNYDFLVSKGLTMPAKETLMMEDGQTIHDANVHALYLANFDYFLRLPNIHKLIKDYCRDLLHIIQRAPPAPSDMFIYRGVRHEDYLKPGTYEYVDTSFSSTSIDPYAASDIAFTTPFFSTPMRFCVYEMKLKAGSPCIFMKSVSDYAESEVLLPYNLRYIHSLNITLKYLCNPAEEFTQYTDPKTLKRAFVRRVEIHGFSGREEPKTFAVNAYKSQKSKTQKTQKQQKQLKYPRVNSIHRKTARNYANHVNYENIANNSY